MVLFFSLDEVITEVNVWGMESDPIQLVAKEDIWAFGPKENIVKNRAVLTSGGKYYPVEDGQKLGELKITLYNDKIIIIDLLSDRTVKNLPFRVYLKRFWLTAVGLLFLCIFPNILSLISFIIE